MVSIGMSSIRVEVSELNVAKSGATVLFVDGSYASASDSNDGYSWAKPFKTIGAALAKATPWTTIYIKGGTYTESITIADEHVRLEGQIEDGTSATIIYSTSATGIIITAGFCEVSNLCVVVEDQHGIQATNPNQNIHDVVVSLTNNTGVNKNGIWLNDSDRTKVERCFIDGNGDAEVIGILVGDDCVDVELIKNYITGCGDGIGAGCAAGVCTNNGYGIGIAESSATTQIKDNTIIDNCVGVYFYKTGANSYKGHSVHHNNFYENCNYDAYDQYDPDDSVDPSGIMIRENHYGYLGWFADANRDGRADYMVNCGTNYDHAPIANPQAWETSPTARSNNI